MIGPDIFSAFLENGIFKCFQFLFLSQASIPLKTFDLLVTKPAAALAVYC